MNTYSNDSLNKNASTAYKQHLVYEVATSLADSKHIAEDYNSAHRYQHRAQVTIVGHSTIRPYDPIYLDGLPNGMSGYWTVISVKHIFGGSPADYMLSLEVGTDVIGDSDPYASTRSEVRDVQSELAGQPLSVSETTLSSYSVSPNSSTITVDQVDLSSSVMSDSPIAIPNIPGITKYSDYVPKLDNIKNTVRWVAKKSGRVIS